MERLRAWWIKRYRTLLKRGQSWLSAIANVFWRAIGMALLTIYRVRVALLLQLRRALTRLSYFVVSVVGMFIAFIFYHLDSQAGADGLRNMNVISTAAGGLIGTMLALVVTLSMIPIQRAVESFSPSVTRLYQMDWMTQGLFVFLAVLSLGSFAIAVYESSGGRGAILIPTQVAIIAIAFDLLRWHHRRTIQLLAPDEAIGRLLNTIVRRIDYFQRMASRLARMQWLSQPPAARRSQETLEAVIYRLAGDHLFQVNAMVEELAQTGHKAVAKGETYTFKLCTSAIARVATHFLDRRVKNLVLVPKAPFVTGTDADAFLTTTYEHLSDLNRSSVVKGDEIAAIQVVRALCAIAVRTANLNSPAFREHTAPMTGMPILILTACGENAERSGMDNVALETSAGLRDIVERTPVGIQITDVHIHAVEGIHKLAGLLLVTHMPSGKGYLANEPIKDIMAVAGFALRSRHPEVSALVRVIAEKLENLLPLAVTHEKTLGSPFIGLPLAPAYDLLESDSFGHLIDRGSSLIEQPEGDLRWANPYSDFIRLNDVVSEHLRGVPDKADLGASFLTWHITQTIKHVSRVHLSVLASPASTDQQHLKDLVRSFSWYLPFLWKTFSKSSQVSFQRGNDACDALAWIGMAFFDIGYRGVADDAAADIVSIVDAFCRISRGNQYEIADLMLPIWYMRMLASSRGESEASTKFEAMMSKPESLQPDVWELVLEALKLRKRQLNEELVSAHMVGDDARVLLRTLLAKPRRRP